MASAGQGTELARHAQDIDAVPALAWSARPDGSAEFLNRRWLDYTGLSSEEQTCGGAADEVRRAGSRRDRSSGKRSRSGTTDTGMLTRFTSTDENKSALVSTVPIKRLAKPEEIARVIAFVASANASYMTGASIPVDGGMIAD